LGPTEKGGDSHFVEVAGKGGENIFLKKGWERQAKSAVFIFKVIRDRINSGVSKGEGGGHTLKKPEKGSPDDKELEKRTVRKSDYTLGKKTSSKLRLRPRAVAENGHTRERGEKNKLLKTVLTETEFANRIGRSRADEEEEIHYQKGVFRGTED